MQIILVVVNPEKMVTPYMFSTKKITQFIFTHLLSHIYYTHTHICTGKHT
jgi:hypothetical protein